MPSEQRRVWMVRREKSSEALPITDPDVAQLYKDTGWEVDTPDPPFDLVRWLVLTQSRRRRRP